MFDAVLIKETELLTNENASRWHTMREVLFRCGPEP